MIEYTNKEVTLSACERYRYLLRREWEPILTIPVICLFVMLNPSNADGLKDDPTLRRCVRFAQREGYSELEVVNLFAWRSPNPKVLADNWTRSIGPENNDYIRVAAQNASLIIAAWGGNETMGRDQSVLRILRRYQDVYCLRTTKSGKPEHPLYLPDSTQLKFFMRKETTNLCP
jgi:hypothetical protein